MYLNKWKISNGRFLEEETIDSLLQDQTPERNEAIVSLGWDLKKSSETVMRFFFILAIQVRFS